MKTHLLYGFCNYLWFYSSSDPHNKEVMAYVMDEVLKHPAINMNLKLSKVSLFLVKNFVNVDKIIIKFLFTCLVIIIFIHKEP